MAVIDRIKADQSGEQPPIGLRQPVADEITLAGQPAVEFVERLEQPRERLLIGLLVTGEAGTVDAVIVARLDRLVDGVDRAAQGLGVEIEIRPG